MLSRSLSRTIVRLPTVTIPNYPDPVVPDFGVVFDIHQDSPGRVQFAYPARGHCVPRKVALDPAHLDLVDDMGRTVPIDDRAKFMTVEAWTTFVMNHIIEHGRSPMYPNGELPTRVVRDARKHLNSFRSFRQMVGHAAKKGGGTTVRP